MRIQKIRFFIINSCLSAVFLLFIVIFPNIAFAQNTWIVDQSGSGDFTAIQACIDTASAGDTCLVKAGIYYENITMKSGVTIQGAGAGDDPLVSSIIDGNENGSVVTAIEVDSTARLDGFTIRSRIMGGRVDMGAYEFVQISMPWLQVLLE